MQVQAKFQAISPLKSATSKVSGGWQLLSTTAAAVHNSQPQQQQQH
jgi:hypothetical protein